MANDIAPSGQLTTTSDVENFPSFLEGIMGMELMDHFRNQSLRFGTAIYTETVNKVDLSSFPFKIFIDAKTVLADSVIVATAPILKNKPLAVIGGGDSAMEESTFLTKYGSNVYIIHRRDSFKASKIMRNRAQVEEPGYWGGF
ncbi:hypothetical protein PTKIN_Ptkin05aG0124900 [Pterospermum kingtungense]